VAVHDQSWLLLHTGARRYGVDAVRKTYLCGSSLPPPLNAGLEWSLACPGIGEGDSAPFGTTGSGNVGDGEVGVDMVPCPEDAPEYLRPQYPKHWSYVHSVEWWKLHWEKTELVDVQCAELLPESNDLLLDYVLSRPSEQDEDSIMRAVPRDHEGLIALFCLVARKRCR